MLAILLVPLVRCAPACSPLAAATAATANATAANATATNAEEEHGLAFVSSYVVGNQPGQISDARAREPSGCVGHGDIFPARRYRGDRADSSLAGSRRVRERERDKETHKRTRHRERGGQRNEEMRRENEREREERETDKRERIVAPPCRSLCRGAGDDRRTA